DQHPHAELDVEHREAELVEGPQAARAARLVLEALGAAELEPRATSRLLGRQPRALEIGCPQLLVQAELLGHLGFEVVAATDAAPERARARHEPGDHRTPCG